MARFLNKGDALFGFLKSRRNKNNEIVFRPVWGRVGLALAALAFVGWLSAALAVMLFVKQARGFEGGKYTDILFYPWRKEIYHQAWGDEFIERGLALIEEGEIKEGLQMVRVGHVKSPSNLEGRLVIAELHAGRGRPDLAGNLLREGLPYTGEDDLDYLRTTFRMLLLNQEDAAVQEIARTILEEEPILTPRNQITALAAATASFYRGTYDRAEDFIVDYELSDHPEGRVLLARIDWERGRKQAALERLERLAGKFVDQEEVYILLTRYYRELGDHTRAHNYAVMRQINNPLTAAPRIALLYSHHAAGDVDHLQREVEKLLADFGHDHDALIGLGEFAAQVGDVDLCRRVFQTADRGGLSLDLPAILLSEAHLNAGQYQEAVQFLESHSDQNETFAENYAPVLNGVYAVAYLGLGDADRSEIYLTRLLNSRNLRAENFLITSQRIIDLGKKDIARRLVTHAHQIDPLNQAALVELIRLDLDLGYTDTLVTNIQKLLTMRKPPRALLEDSATRLGGDQFLFLPQRDEVLHSIREAMNQTSSGPGLTHS